MKKIILTAALVAACTSPAMARGALNGHAQVLIDSYNTSIHPADARAPMASLLALVSADFDAAAVDIPGAVVSPVSADIVAVTLPIDAITDFADLPGVEYIEYNEARDVKLDFARPASFVKEAQEGYTFNNTKHSYDGAGVLTGLMDVGIQPNHINFLNDDGTTRVKALFIYNRSGNPTVYSTPATIQNYTTDSRSESHGTHTSGIMSGGYKGKGTVATISSPSGRRAQVKDDAPVPYYGVATASDIAMAAGSTADADIINAVGRIFDLADIYKQPAVVNLSLGANNGPHDGTDLTSRSLTELAKRGIIVVSAGNEGNDPIYIKKEFTASDNVMRTFLDIPASGERTVTGQIECWGNDDKPFKFTVAVYSNATGALTELYTLDKAGTTGSVSGKTGFSSYFTGSLTLNANVNSINNRYNVSGSCSVTPRGSGYNIAFIVEGSNGQTIYMYGNKIPGFASRGLANWTAGSTDGTINSLAFGENVISVGSYTTRYSFPSVTGSVYNMGGSSSSDVGKISSFSSWGQSFQGKWYPTVCAPGAVILSSVNRYAVISNGTQNDACATAANGTSTDYWSYMQGTSMSSPYAAGVIAMWLQAEPALTSADVINVIEKTSMSQTSTIIPGMGGDSESYRWGAGKIDAVAGLKYVLEHGAGVGAIYDDGKDLVVTVGDNACDIFAAGAGHLTATLYSLSGVSAATATVAADRLSLDTSAIAPGVYILSVVTPSTASSTKVVIK